MTVPTIQSILRRTAPGAPRTQQQLLQASHMMTTSHRHLSVDFKVISCEVSLKSHYSKLKKQKQYYCTFLVPIDCLWLVYDVPSEMAFVFSKS
jgi:hypothetical protein